MNKLYTEEQMFNFAKRIRENMTDGRMLKREQILAEFTPITLPTKEEVDAFAMGYYNEDGGSHYVSIGADFVIEKIKGIQNEK